MVSEGPVGSRALGRFRRFRYELRCWSDGVIPDVAFAVGGPQRLSDDPALARCLLDRVASVPTAVWGRDELRAGEMWNSNSVISWLIARSGLPVALATPPACGYAPGWQAGLVVANRQQQAEEAARHVEGSPAEGFPVAEPLRPCQAPVDPRRRWSTPQ